MWSFRGQLILLPFLSSTSALRAARTTKKDTCVDSTSYVSEMGLGCAEYQGINCRGLLRAGLVTVAELQDLLDHCPISCRQPKCDRHISDLPNPHWAEYDLFNVERELLVTMPSQDGDVNGDSLCFAGWDISCQDDPNYQSPLGGLGCSHFRDTQCVLFKHIGFSENEMAHFANSCPCSCQIECGTWKPSPAVALPLPSSARPTNVRTTKPSSKPTSPACRTGWQGSCQDDPKYISPQGGLCSSVKGYDCALYGKLGFSAEAVANLINSCPCSCGVPCGTWNKPTTAAPSNTTPSMPPMSLEVNGRVFELVMSSIHVPLNFDLSAALERVLLSFVQQNLGIPTGSPNAELYFHLLSQNKSTNSPVISIRGEIGGIFTVPALGPDFPDTSFAPSVDQIEDAVSNIFISAPMTSDFIILLRQFSSEFSSLDKAAFQILS